MNPYLKAYMEKEFDAGKEAEWVIGWIRDWFAKNGPDSPAVIGLSGGKDSTLVAALCVKALGKDRILQSGCRFPVPSWISGQRQMD